MNVKEFELHLRDYLIPFWKNMRDNTHGGYYGWLGYDLKLNPEAEKGCILNSRILWFFSTAYSLLGDEGLLDEARHSFHFLTGHCIDEEHGGVYWSVAHDGQPLDTTKHTYNQAFAIYALSAYYDASGDPRALSLAEELFGLIEEKCRDAEGYLEAFTRDFQPESNEKLSENGVMAERTMNTLLHVMEGYTRLYQAMPSTKVEQRLRWIVDTVAEKLYNPRLHRQEVFFDLGYHSLIDLHSYGHDIETSWLLDRTLEALNDPALTERIAPITQDLARQVYEAAFDGKSFANECEAGVVNEHRVWWVQAEAVVGFLNQYQKTGEPKYLQAAEAIWGFIQEYLVDKREGSEWFWEVDPSGQPYPGRPIVEPWKCPYHNGRMCMEVMQRLNHK